MSESSTSSTAEQLLQSLVEGNLNDATAPIVKQPIWWIARGLSIASIPVEVLLHRDFGIGYLSLIFLGFSGAFLAGAVALTGQSIPVMVLTVLVVVAAVIHLYHIRLQWLGKSPWMFSLYPGRPWLWHLLRRQVKLPAIKEFFVTIFVEPPIVAVVGAVVNVLFPKLAIVLWVCAGAMALKNVLLYHLACSVTIATRDAEAAHKGSRRSFREGRVPRLPARLPAADDGRGETENGADGGQDAVGSGQAASDRVARGAAEEVGRVPRM